MSAAVPLTHARATGGLAITKQTRTSVFETSTERGCPPFGCIDGPRLVQWPETAFEEVSPNRSREVAIHSGAAQGRAPGPGSACGKRPTPWRLSRSRGMRENAVTWVRRAGALHRALTRCGCRAGTRGGILAPPWIASFGSLAPGGAAGTWSAHCRSTDCRLIPKLQLRGA